MATALPPCPIWVAPQPSSMAQLPTHPMPVSRCVSRVLYVSLAEFSILQRGQVGRVAWSEPLPHSLLPSNLSTILSSSDLYILTFYKSGHMMPFQEPTLVVRWQWGCHPPLVVANQGPWVHSCPLHVSTFSSLRGEASKPHLHQCWGTWVRFCLSESVPQVWHRGRHL